MFKYPLIPFKKYYKSIGSASQFVAVLAETVVGAGNRVAVLAHVQLARTAVSGEGVASLADWRTAYGRSTAG